MIERYVIDCECSRPDWPFIPITVPCGSARTIGVIGLKSRCGVTITGCQIRITNADGDPLTKVCKFSRGVWVATFPASHFQNFGTVKKGVLVMAVGIDENDVEQVWIERVGDLRVEAIDASSTPGGETVTPKDVYIKSEIIDGVQHYKMEVLAYSERQHAWGAEYVGDYVFIGGAYVPFGG